MPKYLESSALCDSCTHRMLGFAVLRSRYEGLFQPWQLESTFKDKDNADRLKNIGRERHPTGDVGMRDELTYVN
jgi:hypothetical protein